MDNAKTACLGHRNGEARFGNCVHGRGNEGDIQRDFARQLRANIHLPWHHFGGTRLQQNVVKRYGISDRRGDTGWFSDRIGHGG